MKTRLIAGTILYFILFSCNSANEKTASLKEIGLTEKEITPIQEKNTSQRTYYRIADEILILTSIAEHGAPFPDTVTLKEQNGIYYFADTTIGFKAVHGIEMGDMAHPLQLDVNYQLIKGVLQLELFDNQFQLKQNRLTSLDSTFKFIQHGVSFYGGKATSCYRIGENGINFSPFEKLYSVTINLSCLAQTHLELRLQKNDCPKRTTTYYGDLIYIHETPSAKTSDYFSSNFVFIEK